MSLSSKKPTSASSLCREEARAGWSGKGLKDVPNATPNPWNLFKPFSHWLKAHPSSHEPAGASGRGEKHPADPQPPLLYTEAPHLRPLERAAQPSRCLPLTCVV